MSFFLRIILLFFFSFSSVLNTFSSLTRNLCRPVQKDALLEFKKEFEIRNTGEFQDWDVYGLLVSINFISYPKTESWTNNSDCCNWDGITCDDESGEAIGLDLSGSNLHGNFKPNSSHFRLQHLRDLNLAHNNFTASPIPARLHTLKRLETLNLSRSSFSGPIPKEILHLTRLVSLDLASSYSVSLSTEKPFLYLLSQKMRNLRELDLSYVNISAEIPQSFSNLTSLRSLRLRYCNLFGKFPSNVLLLPKLQFFSVNSNPSLEGSLPDFNGNNSLVLLDFSFTSFSGSLPDSISNLKHLNVLHFPHSNFSGSIPFSLGNCSCLTSLCFTGNNLVGEIPSSFSNLNNLIYLKAGSNRLTGNFPVALLNLTKLSYLNLYSNDFTGTLPPNITLLFNLEDFDASKNSFVGSLPFTFFTNPSLSSIFLDDNQLNGRLDFGNMSTPSYLKEFSIAGNNLRGPIPRSISKLVNLELLDISHLNSQVQVDFGIFSHLKSLHTLYLSGNHVSGTNMSSNSHHPSQLSHVYLSGCGIVEFPEFTRTKQDMKVLDLSDNKIKSHVPAWLWTLPKLEYVDLSNNDLTGFEEGSTKHGLNPNTESSSLKHFIGSNNNFSGEIPSFICSFHSLRNLNLSNNNFSGSLPCCLGIHKRRNHLPETIFDNLRSFDVGHNQLVGKLTRSFMSFSILEVFNIESNKIRDTFPFWLSSLHKLQVLNLRSNAFYGPIHQTRFPTLRIIDISHNHFNGTLPSDFFLNWRAMSSADEVQNYMGDEQGEYYDSMVLMNKGVEMEMQFISTIYTAIDFSGNKIQGEIPRSIGLLKELVVLNLSHNAFTGHIPSSMANMIELESLDLSQNNLSGEIPQELGVLSFLAYMNFSHNQLVGPVPGATQFRRQNCSSFEGNLGLFGSSLDEDCKDIHSPTSQQYETPEPQEEEKEDEEMFIWIAAMIGFVPGIAFGLTIGYILLSYKKLWFLNFFG